MSNGSEYDFFKLRQQAKTYISKVFTFNARDNERVRNVRIVLEGSDEILLGEIDGAMCLRLTGNTRKTQVTAVVTQDHKQIRRLSLQTFTSRAGGWFQTGQLEEFTFKPDEFRRLQDFVSQIKFIDLSNESNFQIEDISKKAGPKTIIDASDRSIVERVQNMTEEQRYAFLQELQGSLTDEEINVLLGRRKGLEEYEKHICLADWNETQWQDFFEREQWVFGYGLDYRFAKHWGREITVGGSGTDNRNKPVVDFLLNFTDYTVLVEIKRPDTPIFKVAKGGRAGTWEFSSEFMSAISQVVEQKAEWASFAQTGEHYDKSGAELLTRTRNAKCILVIGSRDEFTQSNDARSTNLMRDSFELFRREMRSIDIMTFDELLERARFITQSK